MNIFTILAENQQKPHFAYHLRLLFEKLLLIIMQLRLAFFIVLTTSIQLFSAPPVKSQAIDKVEIKIELKNESLVKAFQKIEKQTQFQFMYRYADVKDINKLDLSADRMTISDVLKELLSKTSLDFKQVDNRIMIVNNPKSDNELSPTKIRANNNVDLLDVVVRGQVKDAKGETLPGVSIKVKGTDIGASSDIDGKYTLNVPDNAILVFTYIGYITKEVPVNKQEAINVILDASSTSLSEVVVTALGISREAKSLTFSTQSVKTEELTQAREPNVINSLQGKVAGLSINSSGTGVGSASRVVLRGNRSISSDNQVLYVIDGVPVRGFPDNLNSDNIASINVLKGPNSAALYGSQGQNGAIVIETKQGAAGKVNVSFNNTYMLNEAVDATPYQGIYGQGSGGVYIKSSEDSWGPKMEGQSVATWSINPANAGKTYSFTNQPDARKDLYQIGGNIASNLIASIGGEKTQSVFTYTLTDAAGIIPNNKLQRHNVSLRVTNKLSSKLTLDSKLDYMRQSLDNQLAEGESSFNPNRQILTMPPNIQTPMVSNYEFVDAQGYTRQDYWLPGTTVGSNPYWAMERNLKNNTGSRIIAMTSLSYKFTDAIKVMARGSFDGDNFVDTEKSYFGTYRDPAGRFQVGESSGNQVNGDLLATYDKDVAKDWNVNFNLGASIRSFRNNTMTSSTGAAMLVPNFFALNNTTLPTATYFPGSNYETHSVFSSATIGFKNAIYLDITGRNDWSSTLPAANRSYFYPSLGLGVILSDLMTLPSAVSFAKIRGTWAQVGNSPSPYQLERTAAFSAGGNLGYLALSGTLPNSNLFAETTVSTEFGLDARLFNNRLGFDLTLYKTNTKDQLFTIALPVGSGASLAFINGGDVQNKGFEAVITSTPVKTKNFNWDFNVNFAVNKNKVLKLSDERPRLVVGGDSFFRDFVVEQGQPYGRLYSRGFIRDTQGRVVVGANGLPTYTAAKSVLIGDINPDWTGGISSAFSYKRLSASFTISHKQGGVVGSLTDAILAGSGLLEETTIGRDGTLLFGRDVFKNEVGVKADGTPNTTPVSAQAFWQGIGGRNAPVGEAFISDATNTRLREFVLGYNIPKTVFGKLPVSSVRLSLVGRNLFFLYRASKTLDPDFTAGIGNDSDGFQSFAPPTTRSYGLNLKIDF